MTDPFTYPAAPHTRRHGPAGYADYDGYRPWLRDEFTFRCVFCLTRETWCAVRGQFAIDHFLAAAKHPAAATDYDNLLYSCATCNSAKGDRDVPDPLTTLLAEATHLDRDGVLHGMTATAARLIELVDLNHPRMVAFRSAWVGIAGLARQFDPALFRQLLGFPDDLPDLARLRPPGGNVKPAGIADSHFARRRRGELPETY